MKKVISIAFAIILLLSGLQLTVSAHFCRGELSTFSISNSTNLNGCCFEDLITGQSSLPIIKNNCCHNEITTLHVENNYEGVSFQLKNISFKLIKLFYTSVYNLVTENNSTQFTSVTSSDKLAGFTANAVSLPEICIFRI